MQVRHGFGDLRGDRELERLTEILVPMDGSVERARQELHKKEGEYLLLLVVQIRRPEKLDNVRMCQAIEYVHFLAKLEENFSVRVRLHEDV